MKEKIEFIGKCLFIKKKNEKILVIGDLHFGFEESLREGGVYLILRMLEEAIKQLEIIFKKTGDVNKIVLLGDVKHAFGITLRQERNDIIKLFEYMEKHSKKIVIVKGNHDVNLEPLIQRDKVKICDYYIDKNICFMHGDRDFNEAHDKKIDTWIIGHMHPAVYLQEGVKSEKYKCFLVGKYKRKKVIIAPSFVDYSEGSDPREDYTKIAWNFNINKFKVHIVASNLEVLEFGMLKDI